MEATITSKGQITIPKALRDAMHLKAGDKLLFEEQETGTYIVKPRTTDVRVLKGCVAYSGEPKTVEEMNEAIAKHAGAIFP